MLEFEKAVDEYVNRELLAVIDRPLDIDVLTGKAVTD